jgi:hypothetical protein
LWLTGVLAVGLLGYRAYPMVAEPFRQAARVEQANERIAGIQLAKSRERDNLSRQVHLASTDEGKRDLLRRSAFVPKGYKHLRGDGIGTPPSEP